MKLPTIIEVGPFIYTVASDLGDEGLGHCDTTLTHIRLGTQSPSAIRDSLLHECLHAVAQRGQYPIA